MPVILALIDRMAGKVTDTSKLEPGIGVLIDTDRLTGRPDEKDNPYFISMKDGRVYGSSPAEVIKIAAKDPTQRVKETPSSAPGVGVVIDRSRLLSDDPDERRNPYFIPLTRSSRLYSSSPEEVVRLAANPGEGSIFSKKGTALERAGAATRKIAGVVGRGAVATGKAIGKGAAAAGRAIGKGAAATARVIGKGATATGRAVSTAFTRLTTKLADYRKKPTPAAKKELDAATTAAAAEVGPTEAAKLTAAVSNADTNPAKAAAVLKEAELAAKPTLANIRSKGIRQANGTYKPFGTPRAGRSNLQGIIGEGGGRTKKHKLKKRARVSSKRR